MCLSFEQFRGLCSHAKRLSIMGGAVPQGFEVPYLSLRAFYTPLGGLRSGWLWTLGSRADERPWWDALSDFPPAGLSVRVESKRLPARVRRTDTAGCWVTDAT